MDLARGMVAGQRRHINGRRLCFARAGKSIRLATNGLRVASGWPHSGLLAPTHFDGRFLAVSWPPPGHMRAGLRPFCSSVPR